MKRSLITGGAGFIGQALARRLVQDSWRVTILDNFSPQVHDGTGSLPPDLADKVALVRGDVADKTVLLRCLQDQDVVVHLAAETGTGQSMYEIARYERTNIGGTAMLLDCLVNEPGLAVKKLIVASSRAVYGEGRYECPSHGAVFPHARSAVDVAAGRFEPVCPLCHAPCRPVPTDEESRLQPASFYALTKLAQEQMVLLLARTLGISAYALRYQNVYGPGQSLRNPYTGILAIFANLARVGAAIDLFEDGNPARDFVFIDDVVEATRRCLSEDCRDIGVFNVGSGEATTVGDVARAVVDYFGGQSSVRVTGAWRAGDIRYNVADIAKARAILGYNPQWRFADGVRMFLDWARQQPAQPSGYAASLQEMRARNLFSS